MALRISGSNLPTSPLHTHTNLHTRPSRNTNIPRTPESHGEDRSGRSFIHSFIHATSVYREPPLCLALQGPELMGVIHTYVDPATFHGCLTVVLESTWEDPDRENPGVFQVLEPSTGGREVRPRVGSRQGGTTQDLGASEGFWALL